MDSTRNLSDLNPDGLWLRPNASWEKWGISAPVKPPWPWKTLTIAELRRIQQTFISCLSFSGAQAEIRIWGKVPRNLLQILGPALPAGLGEGGRG